MSPFAIIYWIRIKDKARSFSPIPSELIKEDVKLLARADVISGKITSEQYAELIGETYAP